MNINNIVQNLSSVVKKWVSVPLIPLPAAMVVCASIKRPGLSSMLIASRIISRQSEFDARQGVNIDGSPNKMNQLIYVMVDEIVKALKLESKVTASIPMGGLKITGTGVNSGGPFVFEGNNVNTPRITGLLE